MKMPSLNIKVRTQFWAIAGSVLLCAAGFLMPFPRSWTLYPLGLSMIAGFMLWLSDFERVKTEFVSRLPLILAPVVYFAVILLNFVIRDSKWSLLEGYFMFLLVPLFILPVFTSEYFRQRRTVFMMAFISGIFAVFILEMSVAVTGISVFDRAPGEVSFDPDSFTSPFLSQRLSVFEHPTYLAIKVLFAAVILYLIIRELKSRKILPATVLTLFLIYIYLLSSRTVYLASVLVLIFLCFYFVRSRKIRIIMSVILPVMILLITMALAQNPRVSVKIKTLIKREKVDNLKFKDLDPRFTTWMTSADLIREHPFAGVGLDSREKLVEEYRRNGYNNEAQLRLNSHNQFLETQLALGIPGTAGLLLMLFIPLFFRQKLLNTPLYFSFLIILITTFMFESVLERQWGIMFFNLFYIFQVTAEKEALTNSFYRLP
jgi:O-antigen ligase